MLAITLITWQVWSDNSISGYMTNQRPCSLYFGISLKVPIHSRYIVSSNSLAVRNTYATQDAIAIALLIVKGTWKDLSIHELVNNKEALWKVAWPGPKLRVSDWQVVYSTARIISTFISLSAFQIISHFIHYHPDFISTIGFFMNRTHLIMTERCVRSS